jgi:Zn-finger nucleic acid-binding protein
MQELELCPSCKVAWLERHELLQRRPKPVHEARLWRYAEFTPADVEDLVEVQQWRRPARRGAGSGSNVD